MNAALTALLSQADVKNKEAGTLLADPNGDHTKAATLLAEVDELQKRAASVRELEAKQNSFNAWLTDPVTGIVHPGAPAADPTAGPAVPGGEPAVKMINLTPAGKAWFTDRGLEENEGPGCLTVKQWNAIRTREYKDAFLSYVRSGGLQMMTSPSAIKLLQEGIDDQGGFFVPADILMQIISKKPAPTSTSAHVTTFNTNRDRIQVPKNSYVSAGDDANGNLFTTPVRVQWTGEVPASSTAHLVNQPVVSLFETDVFTCMMSLPLTNDQIEDSAIDLVDWIQSKFAEAVDLETDRLIPNGSGVKQPHGFNENPGAANEPGFTTTSTVGVIAPDDLKTVQFGVPPQYQMNARWVMNWSSTAQVIEKMKDGYGRYLWGEGVQQSGLTESAYSRPLLGRPVVYNQFLSGVASGNYSAAYGDLSGYYLVRRIGFSIQMLNEINALLNQKVMLGRMRLGGDVAEDWKLRLLKIQ